MYIIKLILIIIFSSMAIYLLTLSTGQTNKLSEYHWAILLINVLLIICLLIYLLRFFWEIKQNQRKKVFGTYLTIRLILMFTVVIIFPIIFLFMVSSQFISKTIDSWFSNNTEEALNRSVVISRSILKLQLNNNLNEAAKINLDILNNYFAGYKIEKLLNDLQDEQNVFEQIAIYDLNTNNIVASRINDKKNNFIFFNNLPLLNNEIKNKLEKNNYFGDNLFLIGKIYSEIWIKWPSLEGEKYAIFFRKSIPENINNDVNVIENSIFQYLKLKIMKEDLRHFFILALIISVLISIILAMIIAIYMSQRFISPLLSLAKMTEAISKGDFTQKSQIIRKDEMGVLSSRFNNMTNQLQIAKIASEKSYKEQEQARLYLEAVLSNLNTGVVTLDENNCIKTYNRSANIISEVDFKELLGKNFNKANSDFKEFMYIMIKNISDKPIEFEYNNKILLGKAGNLPLNYGRVIVFDDVTKLIYAQREAAWGEVARRFAHEIRNPLTPIQLSAERIKLKLSDKLQNKDLDFLNKSTSTIIKEVFALQEMVESFKNYAKSASLKLNFVNLNSIVKEVLILYDGLDCKFVSNLSDECLKVEVDTTAIRQVLHNLFKNALESAIFSNEPVVKIETKLQGDIVNLLIINNGKPFDNYILKNAFEPYVTDKVSGTGLGLVVVKKIIEEHGGKISLGNNNDGAWVQISFKYRRDYEK